MENLQDEGPELVPLRGLLELEDIAVNVVRMPRQDLLSARRDLHDSAPRSVNQPALTQVGNSPTQPVGEQGRTTGGCGSQIVRGQSELISDHGFQLRHRVLLAIRQFI
jgi:hypothetical protein